VTEAFVVCAGPQAMRIFRVLVDCSHASPVTWGNDDMRIYLRFFRITVSGTILSAELAILSWESWH